MRRIVALAFPALLAACVFSFVAASTAHADQKLQLSPLILDLNASAGDVLDETITVAAPDDAIDVEIGHADLGFDTDDYAPVLIPDDAKNTTSFSTRGWFSTPKQRYHVPAGATVDIPLTITVPPNTPGGTHMGAALVRTIPGGDDTGGAVVHTVAQATTLVFVAVDGGDPPKPRIKEFDVPSRASGGPIRTTLVVENEGDEYFSVSGTVRFTGRGVDESVALRDDQRVVPGQPRQLQVADDDAGDDPGEIELGRHLKFGRYTITARLKIDPTGTTLIAKRHIWIVPTWVWFVGAALVVGLLALIAWLLRRWMNQPRASDADADADADDDEESEESDDSEDSEDEYSFDEDLLS